MMPKIELLTSDPLEAAAPPASRILAPPVGWPVLDERAYYGLPGDIVRAVELYTEADPVGMLVQLLASFGNVVGPHTYIQIGAREHPARLFPILVGGSSVARKGESWAQVWDIVQHIDPTWASGCVVFGGLSSGEGLVYNVRDPQGDGDDFDPGVIDKRLLVIEEEVAQALRMKSREGNTLSTIIRQAWDHGNLSFLVKHNPNRATNAHVTIIGHITREELDAVFRQGGSLEMYNGFANRCLWIAVRRHREIPNPTPLPSVLREGFVTRLQAALMIAQSKREIGFDASASATWAAEYSAVSAPRPGVIGKALDRGPAQIKRLALTYALIDSAPEITLDHLKAALALWQYATASTVWIFRDQLPREYRRIIEALSAQGAMNRTAIYGLFGNNTPKDKIDEALELLRYYGMAKPMPIRSGGRPSEVWTLTEEKGGEMNEERVDGDV